MILKNHENIVFLLGINERQCCNWSDKICRIIQDKNKIGTFKLAKQKLQNKDKICQI